MNPQILRFPWLAAAAGALLVAAGGLSLLRLPSPPRPDRWIEEGGAAFPLTVTDIGEEHLSAAFREELALQDPSPLFLPTEWNSGQAQLPLAGRIEPGSSFRNFEPKYAFTQDDARIVFPPVADVPADALEAVTVVSRRPALRELGRQSLPLESLPERLAYLQVSQAGGGEERLVENVLELPEEEEMLLRQEAWSPVEMLVAISAGGMIGRPALILASGSERVDNWALEYLRGPARLGARLEPGFYRVLLGP